MRYVCGSWSFISSLFLILSLPFYVNLSLPALEPGKRNTRKAKHLHLHSKAGSLTWDASMSLHELLSGSCSKAPPRVSCHCGLLIHDISKTNASMDTLPVISIWVNVGVQIVPIDPPYCYLQFFLN